MTQFIPHTIDAAPAGSCSTLEKAKKVFGFVPDLQAHMAESPELLERQTLTAETA